LKNAKLNTEDQYRLQQMQRNLSNPTYYSKIRDEIADFDKNIASYMKCFIMYNNISRICYILMKNNPQINTIIVIISGLAVGYVTLFVMNNIFPNINKLAQDIYNYYTYQFTRNFDSMGYIHIWPPVFAILLIFIILLYNRQLG
jgi:ABC-type Fe3+-siderophore transport system permease subunit